MDKKELALCLYSLVLLVISSLALEPTSLGFKCLLKTHYSLSKKVFLIKIYVIVWVRNAHDSLMYLSISPPIQW